MNVTIQTDFPAATVPEKVWARVLTGFDPDKQGGFALAGERVVCGTLFAGVSPAAVTCTLPQLVPSLYVAFMFEQVRYGFLFKHNTNTGNAIFSINGHKFDVMEQGCALELAVADFETVHLEPTPVRHPDAHTWADAYHADRRRSLNPHYRVGAYLFRLGRVPRTTNPDPETTLAQQVAKIAAATPEPAPLPDDLPRFDKGSESEAESLNRAFPLPAGARWVGQLSGVWMIAHRKRLDVAGAYLVHHLGHFLTQPPRDRVRFAELLTEQQKIIQGTADALMLLAETMENL